MPPTTDLDHHVAPRTHMRYSFHSPGLSVLLLPFYTLGSFFGGKLQLFIIRFGMSIFGILLGLQIFLYACQEWKNEKLALGLWAIFSFSSPVFFYSLHIYPEIIVALFSLLIYRLLRFSKAFSKFSLLMIGLLLSSFIWLHAVKYTFILVPLFLYCLWELLKKHKIGWNIIYFLIFPLCLMFLHLLFSFEGSHNSKRICCISQKDNHGSTLPIQTGNTCRVFFRPKRWPSFLCARLFLHFSWYDRNGTAQP